MLKSAEVVLLAVPPPLFRGEARDVVQDERFVIVYNYCENDKVQCKIAIWLKCLNATTADTLSHICRNSFIKFMIPLIPAVSLSCGQLWQFKRRNLVRHIAASHNKSKYRLFPTVPLILVTHRPLKRSEQSAATRRSALRRWVSGVPLCVLHAAAVRLPLWVRRAGDPVR